MHILSEVHKKYLKSGNLGNHMLLNMHITILPNYKDQLTEINFTNFVILRELSSPKE